MVDLQPETFPEEDTLKRAKPAEIREAILLHLQGKSEPLLPKYVTLGAPWYADSKVSCYRHELEHVLFKLGDEGKVSGWRLRSMYDYGDLYLDVYDWDNIPRLELRFIEPTPYPEAEQTKCEMLTEIAKLTLKLIS